MRALSRRHLIPVLAVTVALVCTMAIALPVTSAPAPAATAGTAYQAGAAQPQHFIQASTVQIQPLERGDYSATTPEEIATAKAAAAKKAADEAAARGQLSRIAGTPSKAFPTVPLVNPGSGEIRYPLPLGSYRVARTLSSTHDGADMATGAGTPIYAAAAGTVRASAESIGGYGVCVIIDHVIGGQRVSTLYGHMTYGTRMVQAGDTVAPGQLIGRVGNTGHSFGDHLHFEVRVNGTLVEPIGWLSANAGA